MRYPERMDQLIKDTEPYLAERRKPHDPALEALVNPDYNREVADIIHQVGKGSLTEALAHEQIMRMLVETASRDQKTGLFLGEAIKIKLNRLMGYATSTGMALALAYFDIDDFKKINDGTDHQVGDRIIQALAKALQQTTRDTDLQARLYEEPEAEDISSNGHTQARMGGDEFIVVLSKANALQAARVIDRCKARAAQLVKSDVPEYQAAFSSPLSISVGIAQYDPNLDITPDAFITRAELAMKQAKQGKLTRGADIIVNR